MNLLYQDFVVMYTLVKFFWGFWGYFLRSGDTTPNYHLAKRYYAK